MVAFLNLHVFKCLQDVHVSFMNPSVFVTQPSAKEKINFPSETETHRETYFLLVFSWLNCCRNNRTYKQNSGVFVLKRNSPVSVVWPASVCTLSHLPWGLLLGGFATLIYGQKCRK